MKNDPLSPISFVVNVARLPQKGMPVTIDADAEQRAALAEAHDLLAVDRLKAELRVEKWKRDGVRVGGEVTAEIVQACVVTLEPVPALVREPVEAVFLPENSRLARSEEARHAELIVDPDGPDLPETFAGDSIDVGALAEEFFVLGIDPYPRSPNAGAAEFDADAATGATKVSPFAKLRQLKDES